MNDSNNLEIRKDLEQVVYATEQLENDQNLDTLNKAIQAWEKLISNPYYKNNSEFYAAVSIHIANLLLTRYRIFGNKNDIDNTIALLKQSINLVSQNYQLKPSILTNLGIVLSDRYSRTGDIKDLEEAIENFKKAVELTDPKSPKLPKYLSNLGIGISSRYSRTGDIKDLDEAIENYRKAVLLTDPKSSELTGYLNNLKHGLIDRYSRTQDIQDLEIIFEIPKMVLFDTICKKLTLNLQKIRGTAKMNDSNNSEIITDLEQVVYATEQLENDQNLDTLNKVIQAWEKRISNLDSKDNP